MNTIVENTGKLTASERRFVMEMAILVRMPLSQLLEVERFRVPVSI